MPSLEEVAKTIPAGMSREWLDAYSKEVPVVQEVGRLRDRLDATCKRLADREPSVSMVWGLVRKTHYLTGIPFNSRGVA